MRTSILAVNYYGDKFRDLLIKSIEKNVTGDYEILIHDNSNPNNIGHAKGLDHLMVKAKGKYIFTFDIDSHVLMPGFDTKIIKYYEDQNGNDPDGKFRLIAGEGGQLKPARPCCMFFEKQFFVDNAMSFESKECDGAKFDVGVHFYFKTLSLGYKAEFFNYAKTEYDGVRGNEYLFEGQRFCYHHWYATRWFNKDGKRVHDKVDNLTWEEWQKSTKNLFKQI